MSVIDLRSKSLFPLNIFHQQRPNSNQQAQQTSRNPFSSNGSAGSNQVGTQQSPQYQNNRNSFQGSQQKNFPQSHVDPRRSTQQEAQRFPGRQGNPTSNHQNNDRRGGSSNQPPPQPSARNPFQQQQQQQSYQQQNHQPQYQQQQPYQPQYQQQQKQQQQQQFQQQQQQQQYQQHQQYQQQPQNGFRSHQGGPSNFNSHSNDNLGLSNNYQQQNNSRNFDASRAQPTPRPLFNSYSSGSSSQSAVQPTGWNPSGGGNIFQQQQQGQQSQLQFQQLSSDSIKEVNASAVVTGTIVADFNLDLPPTSSVAVVEGAALSNSVIAASSIASQPGISKGGAQVVTGSAFEHLSEVPPAYCPYKDGGPFRAGFIPNIPPPPSLTSPSRGFGVASR